MNRVSLWFTDNFSWLKFPGISISVTDILEIIILAYLVYKLLYADIDLYCESWDQYRDHYGSGSIPAGTSPGAGTAGRKETDLFSAAF